MFSCKTCKIIKNIYFEEYLLLLLSFEIHFTNIIHLLTKPFVGTFFLRQGTDMMLSAVHCVFCYNNIFVLLYVSFNNWCHFLRLSDEHHISPQKHLLYVRGILVKTSIIMDVTSISRCIDYSYVYDLKIGFASTCFKSALLFQPWVLVDCLVLMK